MIGTPALVSSYDDTASFCKTLQRLTTLLTFYWGAGAISPRCQHQQPGGDKCCAEPMLSPIRGQGRVCTQRLKQGGKCNNIATFCCPRFNHADAVCANCLKHKQLELMGRPHEKESRWSVCPHRESIRPPPVVMNAHMSKSISCLHCIVRLTYTTQLWSKSYPGAMGRSLCSPSSNRASRRRWRPIGVTRIASPPRSSVQSAG